MTVSLVCMSHSPLLNFNDPGADVRAEVNAVFETVRAFVAEVDPTLVVSLGPDHYNGFFYDLMPPYAICYAATAAGDFDTAAGPFTVPEEIAAGMAEHVAAAGIDITISRGALLDHGAVQVPELILGGIDRYPTVPIFVNGVAAPFVPMQRVRLMGEAVGDYLAGLDERVLVIGSGGLSHDPPVPRWVSATRSSARSCLRVGTPPPRRERHGNSGLSRPHRRSRAARPTSSISTRSGIRPSWTPARRTTYLPSTPIAPKTWPRLPGTPRMRCAAGSPPARRCEPPVRTEWDTGTTAPSRSTSPDSVRSPQPRRNHRKLHSDKEDPMELTYQNTSKKIQTDIRNHPLPRGGHGRAG